MNLRITNFKGRPRRRKNILTGIRSRLLWLANKADTVTTPTDLQLQMNTQHNRTAELRTKARQKQVETQRFSFAGLRQHETGEGR